MKDAPLVSAVVDQAFGWALDKALLDVPLGGIVRRWMERRIEVGRSVIMEEVRKGRHWAVADDKLLLFAIHFSRAMQEGAAKRNLRLIAEAMVNGPGEPELDAEEVRGVTDALASLTLKEIYALAFLRRLQHEIERTGADPGPVFLRERDKPAMAGPFVDAGDLEANVAALVRTGWVLPRSGFGALTYFPTPKMDRLSRMVDWEAAVARAEGGIDDEEPFGGGGGLN